MDYAYPVTNCGLEQKQLSTVRVRYKWGGNTSSCCMSQNTTLAQAKLAYEQALVADKATRFATVEGIQQFIVDSIVVTKEYMKLEDGKMVNKNEGIHRLDLQAQEDFINFCIEHSELGMTAKKGTKFVNITEIQ